MDNDITKIATEIAGKYQNAREDGLTESKAFKNIHSTLSTIYEKEGYTFLLQVLTNAADMSCPKAKDAEVFVKGFLDITAGGGDVINEEDVICFERIYDKFPKSQALVEVLADMYGEFVSQTQNEEYAKKLDELSGNNPTLINAVKQRAYALVDSGDKKDAVGYAQAIEQLRGIYDKFPQEQFARIYAEGLCKLVAKQDEESAYKSVALMEGLLEKWRKKTETVYANALLFLSKKQDENGCAETIKKLEALQNPEAHTMVYAYLSYTLAYYSFCKEGVEKKAIINQISNLSSIWKPAENMADELTNGTYAYTEKPRKSDNQN